MMSKIHRTRSLVIAALAMTAWGTGCVTPLTAFEPGQQETLVDESGVAIGGFDPVSYFADAEPQKGSQDWQIVHGGATYLFSGPENRRTFEENPDRFVPAYGGWCAWALADGEGSLVPVDPESFVIQGGRLLLFFDGFLADTRKFWLEQDAAALEGKADQNWQRLLRERAE